jgi:regulator of nonsense transcripts 1
MSKEEISKKIEALGDFSKMKTVGKKAKRIGLLFSSATAALTITPDRCEDIADVETADYIFTDGCGLIAPNLAHELARRTKILFHNNRYTPSVFQIRYRGYKGVVTLDPRMAKQKALLKFRKSMKKFSGGDDHSFAVVDYSKVMQPSLPMGWRICFANRSVLAILVRLSQRRDHHLAPRTGNFSRNAALETTRSLLPTQQRQNQTPRGYPLFELRQSVRPRRACSSRRSRKGETPDPWPHQR